MTLSTIVKCIMIGIASTYSTGGFAGQDHALNSIRPFSDHQLINTVQDKLNKDRNPVPLIKEPHLVPQNRLTYGGGYGGNEQTGMLLYDGMPSHRSALTIRRNDQNHHCFLENETVGIYHFNFWGFLKLVSYDCPSPNKDHNELYWNEKTETRNGEYSSDNDALYGSTMVNAMYEEWFGIPVIHSANDVSLPIKIITHIPLMDNAYIENNQLFLGDGDKDFYPYTTPDMISYLMAFAFTEQHSKLDHNDPSSKAIKIAFSSMAALAVQFYIHDQSDWNLFTHLSKSGQPTIYMEHPSQDCETRAPGVYCSIEHMSQYNSTLHSYYSSGIYRRAFYLLATTPNWDVKKAFTIMVQANRFYWTRIQDFTSGACGILKAAHDFQYDESAVIDAFNQVGVSIQNCEVS